MYLNYQILLFCFIIFIAINSIASFSQNDVKPINESYPWLLNIDWEEFGIKGHHKEHVVAFYHIFAGGIFKQIVEEQVQIIEDSGLMGKLDKIMYLTVDSQRTNFTLPGEKFVRLREKSEGTEHDTLGYLWRFCHAFPHSKVLYFHDKGSFHPSEMNTNFRNFLNCFVLNPHCISTLDKHDTCGWRISPTPHIHYPGNFFWANCRYVKTLFDPLNQLTNFTFFILTEYTVNQCIGMDLHTFPEAWVGSAPSIMPADCMNASIDDIYMYGYYGFPLHTLPKYCPGSQKSSFSAKKEYGLPCSTAGTLVEAEKFRYTFEKIKSSYDYAHCSDDCRKNLDEHNVHRSIVWYGERPVTYSSWMKRINPNFTFPEGTALKKVNHNQVYIFKNGSLHAIPDANTFFSLGFNDWGQVMSVSSLQIEFTPLGEPIPSVGRRRMRS